MSTASWANRKFVVATPQRSVCDDNARALERRGLLRFLALGTRRGTAGVPPEHTRLNPWIGLCAYGAARVLSPFRAESFRFSLLPWFDRWTLKQLQPGDHIISSYGYANECFRFCRREGGKTFLDAGNSHMETYWQTVSEEHLRWNCPTPPFSTQWRDRTLAMMSEVDYVLSPSSHVTQSYLRHGFPPERILQNIYPVDLALFRPPTLPRPKNRPLTIINTGSLSLRKGTPYLLEAFRLVRRHVPAARLGLVRIIQDDFKPVLSRFNDLPIDWSPPMNRAHLAEHLRTADVFVLPSLEEGLARSALEAMVSGLQVVVTSHTGANDFVQSGHNGEIVAIRSPAETAEAILKCWDRIEKGQPTPVTEIRQRCSFDNFESGFMRQLAQIGLLGTR